MLTSLKSCRSPCHILSLQRCGHPIRQIWIRWTTASGISFKRGSTIRGSMMWMSWKNVCWGSGGCWPHHHHGSYCAIAYRLNARVRVNWMVDILNIGLNFEPLTFYCVLFVSSILVSVNLIDINMCNVLLLWRKCILTPNIIFLKLNLRNRAPLMFSISTIVNLLVV